MGDGLPAPRMVHVGSANHARVLTSGLWNFLQTSHRLDSDFRLRGKSVPAHGLILDVFLDVDKLDRGDVVVREEEESDGQLGLILEFLYRGAVSVPEERLDGLLDMARELDFQMLVDAVESAMALGQVSDQQEIQEVPRVRAVRQCRVNLGRRIRRSEPLLQDDEGPSSIHIEPVVQLVEPETEWEEPGPDEPNGGSAKSKKMKLETSEGSPNSEEEEVLGSGDEAYRPKDSNAAPIRKATKRRRKDATAPSARTGKMHHCAYCEFETPDYSRIQNHCRTAHGRTPTGKPANKLTCPECGYVCFFHCDMKRHHKLRHSGQLKCPLCTYVCINADDMKQHLSLAHLKETSEKNTTMSGTEEDGHTAAAVVYSDEEEPVAQIPLAAAVQEGAGMKKRKRKRRPPRNYKCPLCDFETTDCKRHHCHVRIEHGVTPNGKPAKKFPCPEPDCDFVALFQCDIKRHEMSRHTMERPFKCSHCPYASTGRGNLNSHMSVVHGVGPGRYLCDTCGKRCDSQATLVVHNRTHTKERPFGCPHCDMTSAKEGDLKRHISVVHGIGDSPHACEVCGKRCVSRGSLEQHRRVHSNEKPFKCSHCPYEAVIGTNLSRHVSVVHGVGTNLFTCETCGKRCQSQSDLVRHRRSHTQERPFQCHVCSQRFNYRSHFNVHLKKVHQLEPYPSRVVQK